MIGKVVDLSLEGIARRIRDLEDQINGLRSERRGRATDISDGDLTIRNGGNVKILDGGQLFIAKEGRIIAFGPASRSHMADGWLWVETLANPADPFGAGTAPSVNVRPDRIVFAGDDPSEFATIRLQPDGSLTLNPNNNQVAVGHNTTSSSANAVMDAFGVLMRSTSSRRYKQDITDITVDPPTVLKMRPRTWRDRRDVENDPNTQTRYVGFIAEELDDLGLKEFVAYDEQGRPDAIAYDRLAVALLAVVQDQERRLSALEAKTSDNTTAIGKLTGLLRGLLPKGTL